METLTIYQIRDLTIETEPYFFVPKTLKFFGQNMKSFKVIKDEKNKIYIISVPLKRNGKIIQIDNFIFYPQSKKITFLYKIANK